MNKKASERVTLLCIEKRHSGSALFVPLLLKKGFEVHTVTTGKAALLLLDEITPHVIIVNAASLRTNGTRICSNLRRKNNNIPILLITAPDDPPAKELPVNVTLSLPFTIRKLVNRITPYLPSRKPKVIENGHIKLDLEKLLLISEKGETKITPRQARLLSLLMAKPGEVIEREKLFKRVWKTEYMGDTRTLDVHISWLRKAIELDPRHPRHLITIRGVGYRFDP